MFLGCHCSELEIVPVPLLPGIKPGIVTHDELDIDLWLPRPHGPFVIDPLHCRLQQIIVDSKEEVFHQYTLIYLDQVKHFCLRLF